MKPKPRHAVIPRYDPTFGGRWFVGDHFVVCPKCYQDHMRVRFHKPIDDPEMAQQWVEFRCFHCGLNIEFDIIDPSESDPWAAVKSLKQELEHSSKMCDSPNCHRFAARGVICKSPTRSDCDLQYALCWRHLAEFRKRNLKDDFKVVLVGELG